MIVKYARSKEKDAVRLQKKTGDGLKEIEDTLNVHACLTFK
jgi:hypothetical protein